MEKYIEECCKYFNKSFDKNIQQYNSNTMTDIYSINLIIYYKIDNNKNIIYKEDIIKIFLKTYEQNISQEEFIEEVMIDIKRYKLDINNLTIENSFCSSCLGLYYMSTFLDYEPVDIKIALKD
jgi:hypothetical protein